MFIIRQLYFLNEGVDAFAKVLIIDISLFAISLSRIQIAKFAGIIDFGGHL